MFCSQSYLQIKQNLALNKACDVNLVAVSKTMPVQDVMDAIKHGQLCFGENRVLEAIEKFTDLKSQNKDIKLHLIGHLQKNKVSDAVRIFDVIETVDSLELANLLHQQELKQGKKLKYFAQVNIGMEQQKTGLAPEDLADFLTACPLNISGLMCIPPVGDNTALYFLLLNKLAKKFGLSELSMGMSADYELAIRLGATNVRLGSVIFGTRADG